MTVSPTEGHAAGGREAHWQLRGDGRVEWEAAAGRHGGGHGAPADGDGTPR